MSYYGHSDGHSGLGQDIVDQQKCSNASFVLTILSTQNNKEFVLHASPSGTYSDGRLTAEGFLKWLGFESFSQCQHHHGTCHYKVLGDVKTSMPTSAHDIQHNEILRGATKRWAEKFDGAYEHARELQVQLRDLGEQLPQK